MGNNIYAIPVKKLVDEKVDPNMNSFTYGLDIDFDKPQLYNYPTISQVRKAIEMAELKISTEIETNFHGEVGHCFGVLQSENEEFATPISIDGVENETELITEILSFPRGNWETSINFLRSLSELIGPILFYCDSGQMTLVTHKKSTGEILSELE